MISIIEALQQFTISICTIGCILNNRIFYSLSPNTSIVYIYSLNSPMIYDQLLTRSMAFNQSLNNTIIYDQLLLKDTMVHNQSFNSPLVYNKNQLSIDDTPVYNNQSLNSSQVYYYDDQSLNSNPPPVYKLPSNNNDPLVYNNQLLNDEDTQVYNNQSLNSSKVYYDQLLNSPQVLDQSLNSPRVYYYDDQSLNNNPPPVYNLLPSNNNNGSSLLVHYTIGSSSIIIDQNNNKSIIYKVYNQSANNRKAYNNNNNRLYKRRRSVYIRSSLSSSPSVAEAAANVSVCPNKCVCEANPLRIEIQCSDDYADDYRSEIEAGINDYINSLVPRNSKTVESLIINRGHLTKVPKRVYEFEKLNSLDLSYNFIRELPVFKNRFKSAGSLVNLVLGFNSLRELKNGILDHLQMLDSLNLQHNSIGFIGSRVFMPEADLRNLRLIDLSYNKLTSLDTWPLMRATLIYDSQTYLQGNEIERFTDIENFNYSCKWNSKMRRGKLHLFKNRIKYMSDLFNGWKLETNQNILCFNRMNLTLDLESNPYVCDCTDYNIIVLAKKFQHSHALDNHYCNQPERLKNQRIGYLNLNDMVCDLADRCPPECECLAQPHTKTLFVRCNRVNTLIRLPTYLPDGKDLQGKIKYQLHLDFGETGIEVLESRAYFSSAIYLNLSASELGDVTPSGWDSVKDVRDIYLHGNKLKKLPMNISEYNGTFSRLSLHDNPWSCVCEYQPLKIFLSSIESNLISSNILCEEPTWVKNKKIFSVDFCQEDPALITKRILIGLGSAFLIFLLLNAGFFALWYRYRVQIYSRYNLRFFDKDECENEEVKYDAFLVCSHVDREIGRNILQRLEAKNYMVCYHERDFIGGYPILENIEIAIRQSKRTLCLVSGAFVSSGYCLEEFYIAHNKDLKDRKRRLILLMIEQFNDNYGASHLPAEIKSYCKKHTYIVYSYPTWFDQLLYVMPENKIEQTSSTSSLVVPQLPGSPLIPNGCEPEDRNLITMGWKKPRM